MNMNEAILKRKSVRNYDMNPLDSDKLKEIEKYLETVKPYNANIKTHTYIMNDEKQIGGMFKAKAPHYLAITSEKTENYLINVGYILEQVVIYLTSKGIGCCWLGTSKPIGEVLKNDSHEVIIMIAFGKSNGALYRENVSEFKRKNISEISNLTETNSIMEAVRLAPSAMNQQAWYFEMKENEISVYCKKVLIMMQKMAKIDIGIALAHIYIAAQEQCKNVEYIEENKVKSGYEYIVTCKLV